MKQHLSIFLVGLTLILGGVAVFGFADAQTAPQAPNLEQVKADSACRATLKWMQPDEADSFIMSVNGGGDQDISGDCLSAPCTNLRYSHDFRTPEETYTYKIKARRSPGGDSLWSQEKTVLMPAVRAPQVPELLKGSWDASGTRFDVSWDASSGITNGGYRVYYSSDGSTYEAVSLQEELVYGNLLPSDEAHYFKIKAYETGDGCDTSGIGVTGDGLAAFSDFSTPLIAPPAPAEIRANVVQEGGNWNIEFSWDAVSTATKYEFQVSTDSSFGDFEVNEIVNSGTTSYSNDFAPNQTYYYRVKSVNDSGGNYTESMYISSETSAGLPAPRDFSAIYDFNIFGSYEGGVSVRFEWTDAASVIPRDAEIFESVNGGGYGTDPAYVISGTQYSAPAQYKEISLATGNVYIYRVRVKSDSTISAFSNEITVDLSLRLKEIHPEFRGNAWSAHNIEGTTAGIGWISLNEKDGGVSGAPYKVGIDATAGDGTLTGFGWASVLGGDTDEWGWLVFEKSYLSGCPAGECSARIDRETGQVSGWARFICMDGSCDESGGSVNGWDGWVSLRGASADGYGLCFGKSEGNVVEVSGEEYATGVTCANDLKNEEIEGEISGIAWGGPIGGWIVFDSEPVSSEFSLTPQEPTLVIRERQEFFASREILEWAVDGIPGGNISIGTITGTTSDSALYAAPDNPGEYAVSAHVGVIGTSTDVTVRPTSEIYRLSCAPTGGTSIRIEWTPNFRDRQYPTYAQHHLTLLSATTSEPVTNTIHTTEGTSIKGWFVHSGLQPDTSYDYKLRVVFDDDSIKPETDILTCSTSQGREEPDDTPTKMGVYGNDEKTLYFNWKDNTTTTKPYHFEVQRIKVTPASTTEAIATSTESYQVSLSWLNFTTSTPFYFEVERSTSTLPDRFDSDEVSYKKIQFEGYSDFYNPPTGDDIGEFIKVDASVTEAQTYYYRARACSHIGVANKYAEVLDGDIDDPSPVCSMFDPFEPDNLDFVAGEDVLPAIATTTRPITPRNATTTGETEDEITIIWDDMSYREHGYRILRNGSEVESKYTGYGSLGNATGTITYVDDGLNSGTYYTYTIEAVYEIPAPHEPGTIYSRPVSTASFTDYELRVGFSGDGDGNISGTVNCPGSCSTLLERFEGFSVSISPDTHSIFDTWTGDVEFCDNGPTSTSCAYDGYSRSGAGQYENVSLRARLYATEFRLSVSTAGTGSGTVTGNGINCTSAGGDCTEWIDRDTETTLSASAGGGSIFSGWSGSGCSGVTSTSCTVLMSSNRSVTASFASSTPAARSGSTFADIGETIGYLFEGIFPSDEIQRVSSRSANVLSAIEDAWGKFRNEMAGVFGHGKDLIGGYVEEYTEIARGQEAEPLDGYFELFTDSEGNPVTTSTPVYVDRDLDPDSVYIYRVRVVYEDGTPEGVPREWAEYVAGKTLREAGVEYEVQKRPICTANSFCDYTITRKVTPTNPNFEPTFEESEQQCSTNAQCRNIGRQDQRYEER